MTVVIARHDLPTGPDVHEYVTQLDDYLAWEIGRLAGSTATIDSVFDTAVLSMYAHSVIDPRAAKAETWEAVVKAMQAGSAFFAVTGVSEGAVECRIGEEVRSLPAVGPLSTASAGSWLTAFWLAVICREQERMTQLCEIPLERLRAPEGEYDEYIYHWVDVLQTYWLRRPGLVEKLTAALEMSDPSVAQIAPRDLLQGILYPPINLFYHFVRRDVEGFGPALEEALKLHRMYWTLNEDRASDRRGSIALGPLAVACLAYDGELPVNVESEYIPKHLLQRSWLGEFPT
ncbi:hypothetical protein GCM10010329_28070 [Streptomyces spiroverticillatus]|uniref:Immunity 49 family protein n=1 Tax=Streptomyces finlayi TaxID=67296 RepID=A0A918WVV5_9ACTN|nr:immunity 49 family protein [Streptomyces finlayi]GHA03932.1 hypothetical protein GCM10010329_28070 [Streptomyces spiroverticillatus]GHC88061.1 hypothetical protein GCM10010334_20480 [Streptomyces finlayi]